jgi:hypothetical protein
LVSTELLDAAALEFALGLIMETGRQDGCAVIRLDTAGGDPRIFVVGVSCEEGFMTTTGVLEIFAEERRGAARRRRRNDDGASGER